MDNWTQKSNPQPVSRFARPKAIRDILVVGCPVVLLGTVGNLVGLSTPQS